MTAAQQLAREGFVTLPAAGAAVLPSLQRIASQHLPALAAELDVSLERYLSVASTWGRESPVVQALLDVARGPLVDTAARLMQSEAEPVLIDATLFVKSAAAPESTHAHQDISYRWSRPPERRYDMTTWIALDECTSQRGALSFLPGSHQEPIRARQDFLSPHFQDRAGEPSWQESARHVEMRPGDIVAFDARTWHAASTFCGGGQRRALALRWRSLGRPHVDIPSPAPTPSVFGMDTSGALLVAAIDAALPGARLDRAAGAVAQAIAALQDARSGAARSLPASAWDTCEALSLALAAREHHRARPNASAWLRVRDQLIPSLNTLSSTAPGALS